MDARICVITGVNAGIEFETAKSLCAKGATTVMVCRSEEKAMKAVADIKQESPLAKMHLRTFPHKSRYAYWLAIF